MLKQRRLIADHVAEALFEAEAAIDAALAKTALLAGVMPSMRREAGLSALIGQDAVERASETILALTQARRAIVETHKELSVTQKQIGLGAVGYGAMDEKPPSIAPADGPLLRKVG
ncbi:MAG: hypothetical protein U1E50_13390 [Caulobacteraceae bacterium]